jgi:hypothetical protein
MQLLPLELRCLIVELSSGSPNSLAALARTHTSYQKEAERALYNTISISNTSDNSLKCMETLATNSEKAALVRFLTVEYAPLYVRNIIQVDNIQVDNIVKNLEVTTLLLKSLINMHCLSDFRVRLNPHEAGINGLGKILWSVLKILIFSELTVLLATAKVTFDYKHFTVTTTSLTFLKSLRGKPNCRYLDYIPAD